MNEIKRVNDSFYDECLVLGSIPDGNQVIRVALVKKGDKTGLDLRKFKKDGTPSKGILINSSEKLGSLIELINSSTPLLEFTKTGEVEFDKYDKEDSNNG